MYTVFVDCEPVQTFSCRSCAEAYVAEWKSFYGNRIHFEQSDCHGDHLNEWTD